MDLNQCITKLNHLYEWGKSRGSISGKLLSSYEEVIKDMITISEEMETEAMENDIRLRNAMDKIEKINLIVRKCGLTVKGREKMMEMDTDFLDNYPNTVQSDLEFLAMQHAARVPQILSEVDQSSVRQYAQLFNLATDGRDVKLYMLWYRDNCQHLNRQFDAVENGIFKPELV